MFVGCELSCSEHLCIVYNKQPFYLNTPNMATAFSRVEFTRFHVFQTILGNGCVMCYMFLQCGWLFQHTDFNPIILNFMHVHRTLDLIYFYQGRKTNARPGEITSGKHIYIHVCMSLSIRLIAIHFLLCILHLAILQIFVHIFSRWTQFRPHNKAIHSHSRSTASVGGSVGWLKRDSL